MTRLQNLAGWLRARQGPLLVRQLMLRKLSKLPQPLGRKIEHMLEVAGHVSTDLLVELVEQLPIGRSVRTVVGAIHVIRVAHAYQQSMALATAHRLGIFKALADGPCTVAELSKSLGLDPGNLEILLETMVDLKFIERPDGLVQNSRLANTHLLPQKSTYLGSMLDMVLDQWNFWSELSSTIKAGTGHPNLSVYSDDCEIYPTYIRACLDLLYWPSREFVSKVDLSGVRRLLAGTVGTSFAKAIKEVNPHTELIIACLPHFIREIPTLIDEYDLPPISEIVETSPEPEESKWGREEAYDMIFFARKFAFTTPDHGISYLAKAKEVIRPGGMVVLWEPVVENFFGFSWMRTTFALEDALMGQGLPLLHQADIRRYVEQAGFERVSTIDTMSGTISFTVGYQRG